MPDPLEARRDAPLAGRALAPPGGRLDIVALPPAARYVLRASADHAAVIGRIFGVPIPATAYRAEAAGLRAALWLGPDEWLLIAEDGAQAPIEAAFASIAGEIPFSLVDVGHRNIAVELSGADAADAITAGCPLDLDPGVFPPGACTRTLFGKCEIVLWRTAPATFRMELARSYADYVWRLIELACADIAASAGT
jgi:sarcosine oxidase subunit gamma